MHIQHTTWLCLRLRWSGRCIRRRSLPPLSPSCPTTACCPCPCPLPLPPFGRPPFSATLHSSGLPAGPLPLPAYLGWSTRCNPPALPCCPLPPAPPASVWMEHQVKSLGKELTCPLCRSDWGEFKWRPPPPKRKAREEQRRGDVHYGAHCGACKQVGGGRGAYVFRHVVVCGMFNAHTCVWVMPFALTVCSCDPSVASACTRYCTPDTSSCQWWHGWGSTSQHPPGRCPGARNARVGSCTCSVRRPTIHMQVLAGPQPRR